MTESPRPVVLKFGGTLAADAPSIRRLVAIVEAQPRPAVVVVSAMAGVTDALLGLAELAAAGAGSSATRAAATLLARHLDVVSAVIDRARRPLVVEWIAGVFDELRADVELLAATLQLPADVRDRMAARGDLLNSRIVAAALAGGGLPAVWVDARRVIVTDADHGRAAPDFEATTAATAREIAPYLAHDYLPVVGGFVGATAAGVTTTLGRGGADCSAAIVGATLRAREIQIWTDVDGLLTADPRLVDGPRPVPHLSFAEAYELACFGATVLHPATIEPAVTHDITVRVLSSRRPDGPGTTITTAPPVGQAPLTALACRRPVAVIEAVSSRRIDQHAFVRLATEAFERHRATVVLMTMSDGRLTAALDDEAGLDGVIGALSVFARVSCHRNMAIVCAVGSDDCADAAQIADILEALEGVPIHMVSQPFAGPTVAVVVRQGALRAAMARLHERFFSEQPAATPVGYGHGV